MGLSNLVIPRATVPVGGSQSFEVRGISLFDLMRAMGDYGPQMMLMFARATTSVETGPITTDTVRARIADLAREFPGVIAAAIALASDEYTANGVEIARKLPLPVQVDAIHKVLNLTFQSESELGNLVESLLAAMATLTGALPKSTTSPDGIGGSAVN